MKTHWAGTISLPSPIENNHLQMPIDVRLIYCGVFHSSCPTTDTMPFWKYCPGTSYEVSMKHNVIRIKYLKWISFWVYLQLNPVSAMD